MTVYKFFKIQCIQLDSIYNWASELNMTLNGSKFQLLRYGRDLNLKTTTTYNNNLGSPISESQYAKDLGLTMSCDGTYSQHIGEVIQKSTNMCGWVLRTFRTREAPHMLTLYKTMILSILDYCSALWNPHTSAALCCRVENVQRSFTRRIEGMTGLNYWDRLKKLKLYSLQRRRERYLIIYVFKILHNLVPNCGISFHTNQRTGIRAVVPLIRSTTPTFLKNLQASSFNHVAPLMFNLLPATMRVLYDGPDTLNKFKRHLDSFLQIIPDQPTIPGCPRPAKTNSLLHQLPSNII